MDYEEVANVSNSATTPITPTESYVYIAHEIVFTLFAVLAIIANSLIIYTMFRFKRMRIAPYMYLTSWAIADLSSLLLLPSGLRLISIMEQISVPFEMFCIFTQSGLVLHGATVLFVTLVALDWAIAAYFQRASERFRKWYKLVLAIFWVVILIVLFVAVYFCWYWLHVIVPVIFLVICLSIAFLVTIVIQIIRLVQKLRRRSSEYSSLGINLVTAFLGCWVLSVLNMIFISRVFYHPLILIISLCLVYSSSVVNFVLLYRFNNDFGACLRQVLSCKRIKYQEDLTEGVTIQNNVNSNSVSIDFRNSTTPSNLASTRRM